jgi:hypothetical protein
MATTITESVKELFHEQLRVCTEWIHTFTASVSDGKSMSHQDGIAYRFLDDFLKLYLTLQCHPELKESSEYQKFLQESFRFMLRMSLSMGIYQMNLYESLIPYDYYEADPYDVYWSRSAIEAVKEIYQEVPDSNLQYYLSSEAFDCEDIDGEIAAGFYALEPESAIPVGIPCTHWWWWGRAGYPNKDCEGE